MENIENFRQHLYQMINFDMHYEAIIKVPIVIAKRYKKIKIHGINYALEIVLPIFQHV